MKRTFTPFLMMLLLFAFSLQSKAQGYWNRGTEPVTEIKAGTNYILQDPWTGNNHHLCGTTCSGNTQDETIYNFVDAGTTDDGLQLYRLKQIATGKYLEDPDLSGGKVSMTDAVARAFVFTALPGVPIDSRIDTDGDGKDDTTTEEWTNGDPRTKYEPTDQTFENVFVFCNKNLNSEYLVFEVFPNGYNCMWTQYTNARIWHIYEATKASAYDDLCNGLAELFPNGSTEGLFVPGTAPGQVAPNLVEELNTAFKEANDLSQNNELEDEVYTKAFLRLKNALEACKKGITPVEPGYYVIDNCPRGGRPQYAGTDNACMTDVNGYMRWAGFNKPEVMNVEGAAFIWEVKEAEDGGFYLRNYGTNRYAGSMKSNYQCVPSSETPSQVYDINFRNGEYFSMDQRGQNEEFPALHADQNSDKKIVIWRSTADASLWKFIPVAAEELEGINKELEQRRMNVFLNSLYSKALNDYNKGFAYTSEYCTRDGVFSLDNNLITSEEQMVSNAMESPDNEPGNAYANLIDGVFTTYFHTVWSSADYSSSFHYLDVRLDEAVKTFNIKYACRHNNSAGSPVKIHVYASNDTTNGNWSDQGFMNCTYPYSVTWKNDAGEDVNKNNFAGVASHDMDGEYKYIRFSVEGTKGNGKTNGNLFWYWSELRLYKSAYDPSISLIEAVPTEVKNELTSLMEKAKAEIEAKQATKETIEALQAAYDKFIENYPDPQIVKNLLKEADAQAAGAVEDEGLGFFEVGATDALKTVLDEVRASVKPVMTIEEVKAAKQKIEDALAAFTAKLNMPGNNEFFYIKSATSSTDEGSATDQYLYAMDNDESQVKYALPEYMGDRPEFVWKSIKNEDGSYSFMNCKTGTYLGNPKENNVRVNTSFESDTLRLRSAKVGGLFNFVCTDGAFYNAQPGTGNLVTWGNASGSDNSAFAFEPFDDNTDPWDEESVYYENNNGNAKILSYPFPVISTAYGCVLYQVLGIKDGLLQLNPYEENKIIPAATAFIAVPEETDGEYDKINIASAVGKEDMTYVFEGEAVNGLMAAVRSVTNIAGAGIMFENNIIQAVDSDKVPGNSGYFVTMPKETTEDGALTMQFPDTIQTGIQNVVVVPSNTGVYSISGIKVRNNANLKNLPKGVYIVGGQKVLVK